MADIEYSIKSTLPIKVTVGASEASATICWLGAVKDNTNCLKCDEEKIYCENVYIGANDCTNGESSARTISADSATTTIFWHDIPIPYEIIQSAATCSSCGEVECTVDVLNHWVSPYIVEPCASSTTLYWEYWITKEDECDIFREKVLSSTTLELGNSACIDCHEENRTQTGDFNFELDTESCHLETKIPYEYYIQKPDVCCDLSGDCYEINEIVYNPTSVSSEGGLVDFSFDYKRIEIDEKCETKETYGTYFGKWQVPPCKGDDCCYAKTIQSAFTWFDICGRGDVSACTISSNTEYDDGDIVFIPNTVEGDTPIKFSHEVLNDKNTIYLSILRDRSVSADCDVHCDFDTLYCVDKSSIKMEYYDYDTGKWSGFTEDEYIFPYYGGRLKVSWNYYIITVYDDCKVGVSSGNPYTDLLTVLEYDDCKDHEDVTTFRVDIDGTPCTTGGTASVSPQGICASNNPTRNLSRGDSEDSGEGEECKITVTSVTACTSGGSVTIKPLDNIVENKEEYKFKKGLCDLLPSQLEHVKRNLPPSLQYVCDEEEKCNEFTVTYYQFKKDCNPDCVPCLDNYMIDNVPSGGTTVERYFRSSCVINEIVYGDGEMIGSTLKNDCSDWVKATVNGSTVTFKIDTNIIDGKTGPYRRGKVIFIHDNNCKEEVIINQHGTSDNEDYEPDPGYECDLYINSIEICSSGGTGTITPNGGKPKDCDDTNITFYPNATPITVGGCGGNYLIGNYSYKCSNFDIEKLGFYPKDQGMYKVIVTNDVDNRKGTITGVFDENPNTQQRVIKYTIEYDGSDIKNGGIHTITQEIIQGDCNKEFDTLLEEFNEVLSEMGKTQVSSASTPNVYNYLKDGYDRALEEYEGDSELFDESFYNEVYNYHGTNTKYHDTAKNAMLSWLMAMQLSELYADSGVTTNTQTELFLKAYNIGGGRSVPVYNENDLHSDVFIARYAASAMYAITRADYTFEQMDSLFRSETNTTPIDRLNSSWTNSGQDIYANCNNSYDSRNSIGYALSLNGIFPSAAGPYADNYYNGDLICRNVPERNPDGSQPSSQFNPTTKNYLVDETIDNIVTSQYNLSASDTNISRTVQAVADDEDDIQQMLGGITYYKYNASSPKTTFEAGSPNDNMGSFHGTFNVNVIGKDLSSLIHNPDGTETDIAYFFGGVAYIGGHSRQTILDPQYGRRRPGQGQGDALYNGDTVLLTATPRCLCNTGCNTNLNYLVDTSITRLVGGGTKLNSNHYYYVDNNGDGEYDSGEPTYGDGIKGTTNECAGLHASTYPSGHSSEIWTVALFLMQMLPNRYKEIYKAAYDYTVSRTIVRAHWNSDTMYGKLVATTMTPIINAFRNAHNGQNVRSFYNAAKTMIDNAPSVNI